ncbi:MAG TPA: trigger factor [Mycobacteriales bacterium]|nr:trigger factor [Mycobacteriales bacterium]
MKSTVETLSPTRVRLAVEVPFDELGESLARAYKSIAGQVRVPGFRPGKAPARIIDQRVGRAAVLQEAVQDAVPRAYADAVTANNVRVLGQPDIELTKLDDGQTIEFTAEVDVRPEVRLPDMSGLTASVDDAEVTEEDVQEQIAGLRERFAVLKAADRPVAEGDYVSIDLIATVDGAEVEGGSTTGMSYQVGSGDLVPGLDDVLAGMLAGGSATFSTELVKGEQAGQAAEVTVTVRSVKEKELPDLDDEFAQSASEFDTLDELSTDIRDRLGRVKLMGQAAEARDKVLDALLAEVEIPLPESVVSGELEWREQAITRQLDEVGSTLEEYLEHEGQTSDELRVEMRQGAEQAVKTQILLDAVADTEQVGVSDAELTEHIIMQAQRYGMAPQQFAQQMSQAGNLPTLVADVRRNKALLAVVDAATVTDASGRPVDVAAIRRQATGVDDEAGPPEAGPAGADAPEETPAGADSPEPESASGPAPTSE